MLLPSVVFLDLHNASLEPDALLDPLLIETKDVVPSVPNTFNAPDWLDDVTVVPTRNLPSESTLTLSLPPVSTVNVSAAGNQIAVLVSPV